MGNLIKYTLMEVQKNFLVENVQIAPISTPAEDLKRFLGKREW